MSTYFLNSLYSQTHFGGFQYSIRTEIRIVNCLFRTIASLKFLDDTTASLSKVCLSIILKNIFWNRFVCSGTVHINRFYPVITFCNALDDTTASLSKVCLSLARSMQSTTLISVRMEQCCIHCQSGWSTKLSIAL